MKVLAFDLSTKTGWALFENGKLSCFGQLKSSVVGDETHELYPQNFIAMANVMAQEVLKKVLSSKPDYIVTEETNKGKNRFSQKQLEFIHFAVNTAVSRKIYYIDTSDWRSTLGITLDKEQRKGNRTINAVRKAEFDRLYKENAEYYKVILSQAEAQAANKRELNSIRKLHDKKITKMTKDQMKKFRYKEEGKVVGKINCKTLSVNYANEHYNLKLKKKDNDIADAICVGKAFSIKKGLLDGQG